MHELIFGELRFALSEGLGGEREHFVPSVVITCIVAYILVLGAHFPRNLSCCLFIHHPVPS